MTTEFPIDGRRASRGRLVALLAAGYYAPVLLVWSGVIDFRYRFHILIAMTVILAAYALRSGYSLRELGIRRDTLAKAVLWNGCLSLVTAGALLVAYWLDLIRPPTVPEWSLFFAFYVLISSPAQEFLYRGVLFASIERAGIRNQAQVVAISATTYCFLHIIYRDAITLAATLVMGIVWGLIYYRVRNLWGPVLSHALLGAVSIAVGLV